MLQRAHLWIVLAALAAAGAGMLAGHWFKPQRGGAAYTEVGRQRVDFARPDLAGSLRHISEWDGKLVVLNFWASWCAPCRSEMPLLSTLAERESARGLAVIGVAVDEVEATRGFLVDHPVKYPILVDPPARARDLSSTYGNVRRVLPYTVLIGRDGRILAQQFGEFDANELDAWIKPYL